ncbi:hypothetical protein ElyMa_006357200 [Elysia marginata]|uniref:Uncharacterized protein n=1 Tax=Elysia marginata TaxID=1093978 RepID=A0AAV4HKP8_9GAST|nr:hypothetical protein ElyMa_006357200 [Elysia marginata]
MKTFEAAFPKVEVRLIQLRTRMMQTAVVGDHFKGREEQRMKQDLQYNGPGKVVRSQSIDMIESDKLRKLDFNDITEAFAAKR